MSLSHKQLKLLWGPTNNVCAFPECKQALVEDNIVVGEMAHILGEKLGSNRYDSLAPGEVVDGIDNRIVLCPTHHTIIDKRELEGKYSVEILRQWKVDHEKKYVGTAMTEDLITTIVNTISPNITQVSINSPGSIQALGDVNIHNPLPSIVLLKSEGAPNGSEVFGKKATLYFGPKSAASVGRVVVKLVTEGKIENYSTAVVGSGMVTNNPCASPSLNQKLNTFTWGQQFLNVGNVMKIELEGIESLGRIYCRIEQ